MGRTKIEHETRPEGSAIDTDFLGHSYFSDNWPLLSDIHSILQKDDPPDARFGLMEMGSRQGKYYASGHVFPYRKKQFQGSLQIVAWSPVVISEGQSSAKPVGSAQG